MISDLRGPPLSTSSKMRGLGQPDAKNANMERFYAQFGWIQIFQYREQKLTLIAVPTLINLANL